MGLVFVPKVLFIRKHAHDPREKEEDKQEEERRYKEVVKENELLQKKVQEVRTEGERFPDCLPRPKPGRGRQEGHKVLQSLNSLSRSLLDFTAGSLCQSMFGEALFQSELICYLYNSFVYI